MKRKPKYYNPDPQSYYEPELPEVDDNDEFDAEPDQDDSKEEMIMDRGIEADNNSLY
jgi:hypothetical protein